MTSHQIIDLQLELLFGSTFPQKIQRLIDEELNQGHWVDGYHLAVSPDVLDKGDALALLEIVLKQRPDLRIDLEALEREVEACLPQGSITKVLWIVDESGSFALTDSLSVARFDGACLVWISPRISYDGIEFDSLSLGKLHGRAWWLAGDEPSAPFVFDFETGELLKGIIVDHEK